MEDQKPIKRSKELVSLSSDHHNGLLLCWKIRTGIANDTSVDRIAAYVTRFFDMHLKPHFETEEELVFTLLPQDNRLRLMAETDHKNLELLKTKIIENESERLNRSKSVV